MLSKPLLKTKRYAFSLSIYNATLLATASQGVLTQKSCVRIHLIIIHPTRRRSHFKIIIENISLNSQEFNTTSGNLFDNLSQFRTINN